ncbi:Malate-2H(+)/Na(+)-lactate antiporter [bioreactor metagenome]|uniref:Malate-2H(+)/Na(+)-lactate antiporter n=1 Tax=bioreactor metagenome TaxID=1076179 RepID=A0A644WWN8_9ZZZZ
MDLLISFLIFTGSVVTCLVWKESLCWALLVGLVGFFSVGLRRGFAAKELLRMVIAGGKTSFVVFRVLFLIGCLTALWRASGTISVFVYYGIKLISPRIFILIAFLLPMLLAYALGTSFGVTGTAGVMLMILARSGGVNEYIAAGAIISGAYFGDMCSPASSAAVLASTVSGADHRSFLKLMLKTSVIPVLVSLAAFGLLSLQTSIRSVDTGFLSAIEHSFRLSWPTVLPALLMLALPWFKIGFTISIAASAACAFAVAALVQGQSVSALFYACFLGYTAQSETLRGILSGGGAKSMLEVMFIILLASTYSGIFEGTGMLVPVQKRIGEMTDKIGLFPAQIVVTCLSAGVFCSQTMGIVLSAQLLGKVYEKKGSSKEELAVDIGNSIITIAGLIPWSIAATVPLSMLGVGPKALLFSIFLYAVPLCYLFSKNIWFHRPPPVPEQI